MIKYALIAMMLGSTTLGSMPQALAADVYYSETAKAIENDDLPLLNQLIDKGYSMEDVSFSEIKPNDHTFNGFGLIHYAAMTNKAAAVQILRTRSAEKGIDLHFSLVDAAAIGDLDSVREFVKRGDDINQTGIESMTALQLASQNGHRPVVRFLLKHGAKFESLNLLTLAAGGRHADVFIALVEAGVTMDDKEREDATELLMDVGARGWVEIVRLLLSQNVPVNKIVSRGYAGLESSTPLIEAARKGQSQVIELLFQAKADPYLVVTLINFWDQETHLPGAFEVAKRNHHEKAAALVLKHMGFFDRLFAY